MFNVSFEPTLPNFCGAVNGGSARRVEKTVRYFRLGSVTLC